MRNDMVFKGGSLLFLPLIQIAYTARPPNTLRDFLRDNASTKTRIFKYERSTVCERGVLSLYPASVQHSAACFPLFSSLLASLSKQGQAR
jgi:hypothetical protein